MSTETKNAIKQSLDTARLIPRRVHWSRLILPKIVAEVTGAPRYQREFEWSDKSWTFNSFRFLGTIFFERAVPRPTVARNVFERDGKIFIEDRLYTIEAHLSYFENSMRRLLSANWWAELNAPQYAPMKPVYLSLAAFGFLFTFKTNTHGVTLPLIGLAVARSASATSSSSFDCAGGTLLFSTCEDGNNSAATTTYAGVTCTEAGRNPVGSSYDHYIYWKSPTSGANSFTSPTTLSVIAYSGTNTTTPFQVTNTASGASSVSCTPTVSNCWITGAWNRAFADVHLTSSTDSNFALRVGSAGGLGLGDNGTTVTANSAYTLSYDSSTNTALFIAAIQPPASVSVTVTPSVLAGTFSVVAPSESGDSNYAPSILAGTFSLSAPTISAGATVTPAVVTGTFSIIAPDINLPDVTVLPSVVGGTFSLGSPTITAIQNVTIAPAVLSGTFSIFDSSVAIIQSVTTTPSTLTGVFSLPSSVETGDFWQPRYPTMNGSGFWGNKY